MKMCVSILSSALKSEDFFFRQNFYFIIAFPSDFATRGTTLRRKGSDDHFVSEDHGVSNDDMS